MCDASTRDALLHSRVICCIVKCHLLHVRSSYGAVDKFSALLDSPDTYK